MSELKKMGLGYVHDTTQKLTKEQTLSMFKEFLNETVLALGEPQNNDVFQILHLVKIGDLHSADFDMELLFEEVIRHLKD